MRAGITLKANGGHLHRLTASRGTQQHACRRRTMAPPQAIGRGIGGNLGERLGRAITGGGDKRQKEQQQQQQRQREQQQQQQQQSEAQLERQPREAEAEVAAEADAAAALAASVAAARAGEGGGAPAAPAAAAGAGAPAAVPEAVRVAGAGAGARAPATEYEEVEVEVPVRTAADYIAGAAALAASPAVRKGLTFGGAAFLGATFAVAAYRVYLRGASAEAQRRRTVDRNKALVQGLAVYLPARRGELTPAVAARLQRASSFTPVEAFRKWLWYLLRERRFDGDAVSDMVALKRALALSDADVAEALRERAQRIYDKYGTLMLNTEGMSAAGLARKATCQALFAKMLYLAEHEPLIAAGGEAAAVADLRNVFGATEEDCARLRITSLSEFDAERLERLMAGEASGGGGGGGGGGGAAATEAAAGSSSSSGSGENEGGSSGEGAAPAGESGGASSR